MKQSITFTITLFFSVVLLFGCGPSEEELQRQQAEEEQARLDSLERVWEAEMEQIRQDSIAQAREDSIARAETEAEAEEQRQQEERERERAEAIRFQSDGPFTVQVRSWRSEERAEEHADMWRRRGYEHAYIVSYGDESTGDVWFRVRLGNVPSYSMAQRLKERVESEHDAQSWVASSDN